MSIGGYDPYPDTVLYNAQILTLDRSFSTAQSLAIKGDRIVALGTDDQILSMAGSSTRRIDAGGRTVVPGFIDTHAHMDREGLRRHYPTLQGCRSIAEVQEVVRRAAIGRKPGEWVVILPLGEPPFHLEQEQALVEGRFPNRHELDQVAPRNPVWVRAPMGFWSGTPPFVHLLNSAGLQACGITRDSTSPTPALEIERDPATGDLTGRVLEKGEVMVAESTVLSAAPRFTREVRTESLKRAMALSLAAGTTSVFEGHGVAAELLQVYRHLHDRGEITVRTYMPISPPPWRSMGEAARDMAGWAHYASGRGFGDEWLKVGGIYLNYGGRAEAAAFNLAAWPYTGWYGFAEQCTSPEEYRELCRLAASHRLRVATSVANNVDAVLTIWEEIDREYPIRDLRWVMVHLRQMDPGRDFPRVKRLGLVATTQPSGYLYRSGLSMLQRGIDEDRLMAHRDYDQAGITWALSSDNKPYWLMFSLWLAVARREMVENRVLGPRQRIGVPAALRALTYAGACVCFEEDKKGSLEVGKLADLLLLSVDPLRVEEEVLKEIKVDLTMVGGRVLHSSGEGADLPEAFKEG